MQQPDPLPALRAPAAPARPRLDRIRRGAAAEILAARHLRAHGLEVLARNVRCRGGEIDLLCREGEVLVVVEVRMRARGVSAERGRGGGGAGGAGGAGRAGRAGRAGGHDYGGALASVGSHKRRTLLRATRYLLLRTPELRPMRLRFDVVGIERRADGALELSWIRDAFRA